MQRIAILAFFALATNAVATPSQDFSAVAAEAAKRSKTDTGDRYGFKFVKEGSTRFVTRAMQGCDNGDFAIGSTCDFILIISSSGHIEQVLRGDASAFAQCIFFTPSDTEVRFQGPKRSLAMAYPHLPRNPAATTRSANHVFCGQCKGKALGLTKRWSEPLTGEKIDLP